MALIIKDLVTILGRRKEEREEGGREGKKGGRKGGREGRKGGKLVNNYTKWV